jgi:general secretion pathway protein C
MDLANKFNSLRSQSPAYWAAAANQHLPRWFMVLLVVVIAWYLKNIIWLLIPTDEMVTTAPASTSVSAASDQPAVNFPKIAAAHLFGEAGAQPPPVQGVNAPETRLNLKLRGAIAAEDPKLAHAIIADGGGKDKVYFIADRLPGGASLHEVYQDRVILNRGGVLETLRLPKISEGGSAAPRRATSRPAAASAIPNAIKNNPASFTDVIRPQPFMPNGELAGYRVYPGRDRRKFAALGLRPGDLVTEINGTSLNNLQDSMETFRNMGSATQIVLTVERGNTSMVLTLDSEQIATIGEGAVR